MRRLLSSQQLVVIRMHHAAMKIFLKTHNNAHERRNECRSRGKALVEKDFKIDVRCQSIGWNGNDSATCDRSTHPIKQLGEPNPKNTRVSLCILPVDKASPSRQEGSERDHSDQC
jgi:hypothetical protein